MSGFGREFCNSWSEDGVYGGYEDESKDGRNSTRNRDEECQNTNISFSEYVEGMQDNT
jgi:hypothetical protein